MTRPSRRTVLVGGAALALPALIAGIRRLGLPEPGPGGLRAVRAVLATLPAETATVGGWMWETQPWYRDRVDVAAALLDGWDGTELAAWLVASRDGDHAADRVRLVNGWRLSFTEARLLLLSAAPP